MSAKELESMKLKSAVLAPMPSASETTMSALNILLS